MIPLFAGAAPLACQGPLPRIGQGQERHARAAGALQGPRRACRNTKREGTLESTDLAHGTRVCSGGYQVPARTLASPVARSVLEYPFVLQGRWRDEHLSTRPNISESHSGTSTRVPHCITGFCLLVAGRTGCAARYAGPREHRRAGRAHAACAAGGPSSSTIRAPLFAIQKGTRVLISLWDSLVFGRVPGTRPNTSESHR